MSSKVWVFFYGGLINPAMRSKVGLQPTREEPAMLAGFDLRIAPYVNLVPEAGQTVFGLLMEVTHAQLQQTYSQLRAPYLPQAVTALDAEGRLRPALCYIVAEMPSGQAEAEHVEVLAMAAEQFAFPDWYIAKIRRFLPKSSAK